MPVDQRTDDQLRELGRRRQPRETFRSLGEVVRQLRTQGIERTLLDRKRVSEVWGSMVDPDDRLHSWVAGVSDGVVQIEVDDPAYVYVLRRRYLFEFLERLRREWPEGGVRDIRFAGRLEQVKADGCE